MSMFFYILANMYDLMLLSFLCLLQIKYKSKQTDHNIIIILKAQLLLWGALKD